MLVIGEKVNIMSKTVGPAMRERDKGPVQAMALTQVEGGADVLDINLGPATKGGPEMMEWVVNVVQETVPDTRLCLELLQAKVLPAVNQFGYGQVESPYGSGQFIKDLRHAYPEDGHVVMTEIPGRDAIVECIRSFLGKGR